MSAREVVDMRRLGELETVIERGMGTFVEVGKALAEIRDSTLYKESHATFEDYCRDRWDMSRPRAYQLIQAAEVKRALSTTVDIPERQARELAPLRSKPKELRQVWDEVVEAHPQPTAAHVRDAVQAHTATVRPDPKQPVPTLKNAARDVIASAKRIGSHYEVPVAAMSVLMLAAGDRI